MTREPLSDQLRQELLRILEPVRAALADPEPYEALVQLLADAFVDGEAVLGQARIEEWQAALATAWQVLDESATGPLGVAATAAAITDLVDTVRALAQESATPAAPELGPTPREALRHLLDHLVERYLYQDRPALHAVLTMLHIVTGRDAVAGRPAVLHLGRIGQWVNDPADLQADVIGWGTERFEPDRYIRALADAMEVLGLAAWVEEEQPLALEPQLSFATPVPPTAAAYLLLLAVDEPALLRFGLRAQASPASQTGDDAGFALSPFGNLSGQAERALDAAGSWLSDVDFDGQLSGQPFVSVRPGAVTVVEQDGARWSGSLQARLRRSAAAGPLPDVELPGLRLGLGSPALTLTARLDGGSVHLAITAGTKDASLTLLPPDGDGFLAALLPEPVTHRFGLTIGWDTARGFTIGNGTSPDLTLTLPLSSGGGGVLTLHTAHLSVTARDRFQVEVTVDGTARLGPLAVTFTGIGVAASVDVTDPLGALQPELQARAPRGVGITMETGPVVGGGFLAHDAATGRYTGALAVTAGGLALSALGMAQPHDDGRGFSLLAVVTARFTPVPLGFGFTLNAVGGILALHHDVDVDALFAAVRAGTAGQILNPQDPVGEAPRLAAQIGTLFPARRGQHVFGPTVQLGWGSPAQLISIDLALVMSLPDPLRLILVGTVRAVLPDTALAVARLNVDVVGVLDMSASRFDMEGRVYDSVIQALAVTGGFAMRTSWGRDTSFAFAIGGLHPGYTPPAGFPAVDRMGVDLSRGSSFQLRLVGYFAITANSFQLGARADLVAKQGGLSVLADVSFDALLVLDPFELDVAVSAGAAIKRGRKTLCSVRLKGRLRGPGPWQVSGSVSVRILFLSISIGFSVSFGKRREALSEAVDARRLIAEALAAPAAWIHGATAQGSLVLDGLGPTTLAPDAPLAVQQKIAPLGLRLDRLGGRRIRGPQRFEIVRLRVAGADLTPARPLTEAFASGQFLDMPEAERLTAPSFEDLPGGALFAGEDVTQTGGHVVADTAAETIILDAATTRGQLRTARSMHVRPAALTASHRGPVPAPAGAIAVLPEAWMAADSTLATGLVGTYAQLRDPEPGTVLAREGEVGP